MLRRRPALFSRDLPCVTKHFSCGRTERMRLTFCLDMCYCCGEDASRHPNTAVRVPASKAVSMRPAACLWQRCQRRGTLVFREDIPSFCDDAEHIPSFCDDARKYSRPCVRLRAPVIGPPAQKWLWWCRRHSSSYSAVCTQDPTRTQATH